MHSNMRGSQDCQDILQRPPLGHAFSPHRPPVLAHLLLFNHACGNLITRPLCPHQRKSRPLLTLTNAPVPGSVDRKPVGVAPPAAGGVAPSPAAGRCTRNAAGHPLDSPFSAGAHFFPLVKVIPSDDLGAYSRHRGRWPHISPVLFSILTSSIVKPIFFKALAAMT